MKNVEKNELVRIVKSILENELNRKLMDLWKTYAYDYNYTTFRNYLKTFREIDIKKLKQKFVGDKDGSGQEERD